MNILSTLNGDLLVLGIAVIANLILGSVVYLENIKSLTNKLFFIFTIAASVWGVMNFISYQTTNHDTSLLLVRAVMFFAVPFANSFFFLVYVFPKDAIQYSKKWLFAILTVATLAMIFAWTPFMFSDVVLQPGRAPQPVISWAIMVFFFGAIVPIVLGLFLLFRKNYQADKAEKKALRFLLTGVLVMFVGIIIFNFIYPISLNDTRFIPYGALFTFPFAILTTYAILKHKLLNVRLVATEGLVVFILLIMCLDLLTSSSPAQVIIRALILFLLTILCIFLIKSVLTEVRQREQLQVLSKQLADANEQLKQLDQAKSEFLSIASHQLRTPLTAIKGYASMFLEGDFGEMTDVQRKNIKMIEDSSNRLTVLVSDLLDLSRIESGRMEFDFEAVDLCKVIEDVIEEVSPKAKAKNLYLYFDNVNRVCPEIRADEEKLRQVVINLVDNAIKYTETGGITVRTVKNGSNLQMSVIDTGIGVDPKDQQKMFEKFFRADNANHVTSEGTGLGIYVAKKIVEAQGGKLWFESPGIGKGTTFITSFPIPEGKIKSERVKIASMEAF